MNVQTQAAGALDMTGDAYLPVTGTPYEFDAGLLPELGRLSKRVQDLRSAGKLSPETLRHLRKYFRIKNIYHSNAIEGNRLTVGETRLVVMEGLTITGKPLKDTLEAKNLSHAMDLFESLADRESGPLTEHDIRSVHQAILKGIDNINSGKYRQSDVEITGSKYKPPGHLDVPSKMAEFVSWLDEHRVMTPDGVEQSLDPIVASAAAHAWFVTIHPFADGNGRTARIIMNLVLIRCGYPIAIITKEDRQRYYDALEESQTSDLTPFLRLVAECIEESLEEYLRAADEQKELDEWTRSIAASIGEKERVRLQFSYEIWQSAMELLKGFFAQAANMLNEADSLGLIRVYLKEFGQLEFEKYASLRRGDSAKRTWFFRLDFRSGVKAARFLFFFGSSSYSMRQYRGPDVSLFVAYESAPFSFQRIEESSRQDLPELVEIAYDAASEQFICRYRSGNIRGEKVEHLGKIFIDQISQRQF